MIPLKDIKATIESANTKKDGESIRSYEKRRWNTLPRVLYTELPEKLRKEADKVSVDGAKRIIIESYTIDSLDELLNNREKFLNYVKETLKKAKYLVESVDTTPPKVSLVAVDLLDAWEEVTGDTLPQMIRIPSVAIKKVEKIDFPLDKVNSQVWENLGKDTKGQMSVIPAESNLDRRKGKQVNILYAIDFSDLDKDNEITITKKLTPFDELVYMSVSALFNAGNEYITISQIYNVMGLNGRPSKHAVDKINKAITKMSGARIFIDNGEEAKTYKRYPLLKYDGSLLPMERTQVVVRGQLAESAIHIFREPPLISFAKKRKQITTINRELLASPISNTDANIKLQTYLIERIARIKNSRGRISNKILFETLYKEININTSKQKQRTKDKAYKLLDHYVDCKFIKKYIKEKDSIIIKY